MIVNVGSINMDLVVRVDHLPAPGETVLGSEYQTHHGGKGANQAVAAARAGGRVRMVGAVGEDEFGRSLRSGLDAEGIDTRWVRTVAGKSGVAFISVDESGENSIIVSPGANAHVTGPALPDDAFDGARVVLLQLEIPLAGVREAMRRGRAAGATVILNLAPAAPLSKADLAGVDVLVVNEVEAAVLTGGSTPRNREQGAAAARQLLEFAPAVVVTLGRQGAVWAEAADGGELPAHEVLVRDTTAAGDAFVGMLAARLAAGADLGEAVRWANAAGGLAATAEGAQPSIPRLAQVEAFLAARAGDPE